ncbi:TIGR03761 family integrating conjugative element protein [Pseudohalioglobus lutimaris]|uniref:TIGR03761 family integrating conjugative element protein n=2 Tax=Pseudohalioglobus lutimaris TaxID=1737061 RepID=A0A2N5X6F0_9GAMM|nr:TIGR03761 family integrating conjugative element protein [Pseudohalioglobus lutimaris]
MSMSLGAELSHQTTDSKLPESGLGALQGDVWLTIQTYQAQSLIRGRRAADGKPAIIGLIGFADRLKSLWHAIRFDDPYADWWLLKVEEGIADIRAQLGGLQQRMAALMATPSSSLEFVVAQSSRPQRVSLQFANPYAFRAAQLLGEYDQLMCADRTLRHLGIEMPMDLVEQVAASGRWVRRIFALPLGYHCLDICRQDVRQQTPMAIRARERMGDLPGDILHGERLPALRPVVYRQIEGSARQGGDEA